MTSSTPTTRLSTVLGYLGAGPEALADMQSRIERIAEYDSRISVAEIMENEVTGQPECTVQFNCDSYDPPVDGVPDPQALKDLGEILGIINTDSCVFWGTVDLLTEEPHASIAA